MLRDSSSNSGDFAYSHLKTICISRALSLKLKLRLFSAVIASILLYNSEGWTTTHDYLWGTLGINALNRQHPVLVVIVHGSNETTIRTEVEVMMV